MNLFIIKDFLLLLTVLYKLLIKSGDDVEIPLAIRTNKETL